MSTRASTWFVTPFYGHYVHHRAATARLKCLLVSLASVVLCIIPAGLTWAQDDSDDHQCRAGTHCAPHPSGKPCTVCIPDGPPSQPQPPCPASGLCVVDWRNSSGSEKTSGHEDGTASNPFRTLRRAISAAHPGDTLSIRTGLYDTDEPLLFQKTLHIRAENGPVTIYARRMDDILTSTDVPGDQPPVNEQTCLGGLYAQGGLVPNEWMQPSGGENLPALGRVADKSEPNNDLGWDHPFGFDYWWNVVIDDDRYLSLLDPSSLASSMDCSENGLNQGRGAADTCNARFKAQVETGRDPNGILHTEIEEGLLPSPYRPLPGDRVYMRGHRIADCGHKPIGAEMHPPTLVVTARVSPDDGSLRTTVLAMPNITTQTYETGKDFPSAVSAGVGIAAASPIGIPTGLPLVAHTSPRPFTVPIVAKYRVAAVPTVPHRATALNLHYHFVTRPGVNVKVMPTDALSAEVEIHMDPATYQPFSDANCRKETVGLESFDAQAHEPEGTVRAIINSIATAVPLPGVIITLNAGMQVAKCEVPNPTPGTPGTVNDNASVIDASQPYPVYGWLSYD